MSAAGESKYALFKKIDELQLLYRRACTAYTSSDHVFEKLLKSCKSCKSSKMWRIEKSTDLCEDCALAYNATLQNAQICRIIVLKLEKARAEVS
jgi:hypothetical protein